MLLQWLDGFKTIYHTIVLYLSALFTLMTPGTVIWKLFGEKKGKVRLLGRNLICDSETLIREGKSFTPLDQFTNALHPFIPLFSIDNEEEWKRRRDVFNYGNNLINQRLMHTSFDFKLEAEKGNILWPLFQLVFRFSFQLVFNRNISEQEFNELYPGLLDINKIIKRFTAKLNLVDRQKFYEATWKLIEQNEEGFLFHGFPSFHALNQLHQVSSVAEDFLTTIAVQCTDLICHLLILYSEHADDFHHDFDNAFNETLRLYPLTDLWVRQPSADQPAWIASLVQLNRNGWTEPNRFLPSRWNLNNHPPLMSWGFDIRRCPAQKMATTITKLIFQRIINTDGFWVETAKNFIHERTFPYGCQLWIGYGEKPDQAHKWKFPNKFRMQIRRWACEKFRMLDQNELN